MLLLIDFKPVVDSRTRVQQGMTAYQIFEAFVRAMNSDTSLSSLSIKTQTALMKVSI